MALRLPSAVIRSKVSKKITTKEMSKKILKQSILGGTFVVQDALLHPVIGHYV